MTAVRALLACIWLLFSMTATIVAPAAANDMSCQMDHMEMTGKQTPRHKQDTPATPQTVMPCCSQPVLAAGTEPVPLLSRPYQRARLLPARSMPLSDLPTRLEPRPPKNA
ncbi:hypothetical protein [Asticcacaulis taihuensis]|jgi:hypothetical protein|uniref:hypothetical protein n=1 Tax=Asticcacaulis taihuensis TaxID=260084 RepID=UPI0026EB965B|nr:hypothetical protein [Asticcacaulis taihuensis]